jgi:CBS domain-containing protein
VKIEVVCEIVSDLNRRLHAKLYSLVAPQSIREHGCLIVMGSEGRGEQTFRTDQDNGLILCESVPDGDLEKFRADVFDALEQCGFSALPGGSDGAQSGLVKEACGFSRRFFSLAGAVG